MLAYPSLVSQERFKETEKARSTVRPKLWMPFCSRLLVAESSKNILISPVLERLVRAGVPEDQNQGET